MKLFSVFFTFITGLRLIREGGVANATPAISAPIEVDVPSAPSVICLVSLTAFKTRLDDGSEASDHRYDCLVLTSHGPHEVHLNFGPNSLVQRENERAMAKGEWVISFPVEWVDNANRLLPHKTELVKTLSLFEVEIAMQQEHHHGGRRLLRDIVNKSDATRLRPRRLGAIGGQGCGIVIVNTRDKSNKETTSSVERAVYTTASNQFRTCSNNAMSLRRKDATISVTLPRDLQSYNSQTVYDAARAAVCAYYGQHQTCEPATVRGLDHILYSIPFGTSDDQAGYNWAYASIGGKRRMSIYNGGYFSPSTITHE